MEIIPPLSSPLGWYWMIAPLAVMILGFVILIGIFSRLRDREFGRAGFNLVLGVPVAALGLCLMLLALNTQSFVRLTAEHPVAEITVTGVNPEIKQWRVTIKRVDGVPGEFECDLAGDEWIFSARVQKWKPWANVIGMDATYTLDQIANKYVTVPAGQRRMITACSLGAPVPVVNTFVPKGLLPWLIDQTYAEDRRFGSAVYMPLAEGATYRVIMTQSGLNAEAVDDAARAAVTGKI